jgi:hypothetical protein
MSALSTIETNADTINPQENADMAENQEYEELIAYLRNEGHSEVEIDKIMVRVRQYEFETQHDSVMDSIGAGTFDLATIIKEALGEAE